MGEETQLKDWLFVKLTGRWILILAVAASLGTTALGLYKFNEFKNAQNKQPEPVATAPAKIEVTALGRLEPQGELIKLSAPSSLEGTRVARLLVKQGDKIENGQIIAFLDSYEQRLASLEEAKRQVQIAQANLAKVKAGAKAGEIGAQKAEITRLQAQLDGEKKTQLATIARLQAQLDGERKTQLATIARLQAQLDGEKNAQKAAIARLQAQLDGERKTQLATIARLQAQLDGERKTQLATIARLQAQLDGERKTQLATIARLQAQQNNAVAEFERYQILYKQGAIDTSRFDSKRLELETSQQQVNEAQASLKRTLETLIQQINEAQATRNQSEGTLREQINEAKANLTKTDRTLIEQINEAKANLTKTDRTLIEQINEAKATLIKTEQTLVEQINEAQSTRSQTINTLLEQIEQAKATLNQIAEVRPTDVQAAQAEIDKEMATVRKAQTDLDLASVRSPLVGQVLKINARPGERIGDNGIIELGQTDQMYVVAEVYETEIDRVRLGQPASVSSSAFTGKLKGTVDQLGLKIGKKNILNDDPAADQDARVVEVKIRLDESDSKRVAGLTNLQVEVAIDVSPTSSNNTDIPEISPAGERGSGGAEKQSIMNNQL
ncbi:efflux RND transporter periplasmic adaptor subunit [Planktothrix sp. FACHB-1355]|uniref:Efflux RND transporter periplasmic adaptor subunit n=1 Tax=Aerosakkonema funiforme FACHB-1375 TaxID=2949571 RepID=A0A926VJA9_9CYAN|nr:MULTISPECIES: efflux RND transporter periplasmic adaptor subunit [Oscillatoriales]MBD2185021.1 efflux RND transporter periplasmic adaptor subunit [Aerosakkonema funiforme FACHB-1375]MBD3561386.1 efflux RND transporter periplasmic adaptor subunit [Planktothrix sp. FACHB-1355]